MDSSPILAEGPQCLLGWEKSYPWTLPKTRSQPGDLPPSLPLDSRLLKVCRVSGLCNSFHYFERVTVLQCFPAQLTFLCSLELCGNFVLPLGPQFLKRVSGCFPTLLFCIFRFNYMSSLSPKFLTLVSLVMPISQSRQEVLHVSYLYILIKKKSSAISCFSVIRACSSFRALNVFPSFIPVHFLQPT